MDHALNGTGMPEPHPRQRYPDWTRFGGTSHRVLVFGLVDGEAIAALDRHLSSLSDAGPEHRSGLDSKSARLKCWLARLTYRSRTRRRSRYRAFSPSVFELPLN
jgi:hypothetical protein